MSGIARRVESSRRSHHHAYKEPQRGERIQHSTQASNHKSNPPSSTGGARRPRRADECLSDTINRRSTISQDRQRLSETLRPTFRSITNAPAVRCSPFRVQRSTFPPATSLTTPLPASTIMLVHHRRFLFSDPMSTQAVYSFFEAASQSEELQTKLSEIADPEDPAKARDAVRALAASCGFEFSDADYLEWFVNESYSYLAQASGQSERTTEAATAAKDAPVTSPIGPYAQFGYLYSSMPPVPPPMPTYLPPPPYIPPPPYAGQPPNTKKVSGNALPPP